MEQIDATMWYEIGTKLNDSYLTNVEKTSLINLQFSRSKEFNIVCICKLESQATTNASNEAQYHYSKNQGLFGHFPVHNGT